LGEAESSPSIDTSSLRDSGTWLQLRDPAPVLYLILLLSNGLATLQLIYWPAVEKIITKRINSKLLAKKKLDWSPSRGR